MTVKVTVVSVLEGLLIVNVKRPFVFTDALGIVATTDITPESLFKIATVAGVVFTVNAGFDVPIKVINTVSVFSIIVSSTT